jgi:hypothetical protein
LAVPHWTVYFLTEKFQRIGCPPPDRSLPIQKISKNWPSPTRLSPSYLRNFKELVVLHPTVPFYPKNFKELAVPHSTVPFLSEKFHRIGCPPLDCPLPIQEISKNWPSLSQLSPSYPRNFKELAIPHPTVLFLSEKLKKIGHSPPNCLLLMQEISKNWLSPTQPSPSHPRNFKELAVPTNLSPSYPRNFKELAVPNQTVPFLFEKFQRLCHPPPNCLLPIQEISKNLLSPTQLSPSYPRNFRELAVSRLTVSFLSYQFQRIGHPPPDHHLPI